MKQIISSKNFSLAAAIFNGAFSFHSFLNGGMLVGIMCAMFCGLCIRNYLRG